MTDVGDADLVYRLTTPIPTNWHPYLLAATATGDATATYDCSGCDPGTHGQTGPVITAAARRGP